MRILVINNSNLTGALNQSLGVAKAIEEDSEVVVATIKIRRIWKIIKIFKILLSNSRNARTRMPWRFFFSTTERFDRQPDVIISHLGSSEHASIFLARYWSIPNIYVGTPRHYPWSFFAMIIDSQNDSEARGPNLLSLESVPSHILPAEVERNGTRLRSEVGAADKAPIWCCLVGGDCAGYRYSEADWEAMARFMAECATELGVAWVISSSRRTGRTAESILRYHLDGAPWILATSWHHTGQTRRVSALIGAATSCLVTEESLSMISDCVNANRPVFTWGPAHGVANNHQCSNAKRIRDFLFRLEAKRRIVRLPLLHDVSVNTVSTSACEAIPIERRWHRLVKAKARELGIVQ